MKAFENVSVREGLRVGSGRPVQLHSKTGFGRAELLIAHMSPKDWKWEVNPRTGLKELVPDYRWKESQIGPVVDLDSAILNHEELRFNQITNTGRVQLHTQCYATGSILTNGFNYIALTNTAITPAAADTTLSGEISTNGLTRAIGTVTLATGSGTQTTVAKTFTASGTQAAQAAALFTASSSGVMNHELTFTQRSLISGDTLAVTFTITLG
jgi:hypothetical protein